MSDSQRKTIQIIPEHFKIHTSSKTRKKREPGTEQPPKLRMKNEKPKGGSKKKNSGADGGGRNMEIYPVPWVGNSYNTKMVHQRKNNRRWSILSASSCQE